MRIINDVRTIATIQADVDVGFKFLGAGILNIDAGFFFKAFDAVVEDDFILVGDEEALSEI